jgi:dihydrofolate synthase / folylpolyglutamate synthase
LLVTFPDFPAVEQYLNGLINYEHTFPLGGQRDWPKLEPTLRAAQRLNLSLRLPRAVHIAGTKGKGSVLTFLEALLSPDAPALSFSSPHLVSIKERVRLNGAVLPDELWQRGFAVIAPALAEEPHIRLSYFESTLIFYLWAARELQTAVHIVEAGLGGRWDATNTIEGALVVLTPVDYDHMEILRNTLTEIATDKSGIIKPQATVVVARQPAEALLVYQDRVLEAQANAAFFGVNYRWTVEADGAFRYEDAFFRAPDLHLAVSGVHQCDNAAVAIRAAREINPALDADAVRARLAACKIPGRQQLLPGAPAVLLDVAHNPVSFRALAETLKRDYADRKIAAVIGMMKDKDARGSLEAIRPYVTDVTFVKLHNPRSADPAVLLDIAISLGMNATVADSPETAFARLHAVESGALGLVVGSFYLAGDYLVWRDHARTA